MNTARKKSTASKASRSTTESRNMNKKISTADSVTSFPEDVLRDLIYAVPESGSREEFPLPNAPRHLSPEHQRLRKLIYANPEHSTSLGYDLNDDPKYRLRIQRLRKTLLGIDEAERTAVELYERSKSLTYIQFVHLLADHPPSPETVAYLIHHIKQSLAKDKASQGGKAKAAKTKAAKDFVLQQWEETGRTYKSKADFSRIMADLLIKNEFNVAITARRIETAWLPKLSEQK